MEHIIEELNESYVERCVWSQCNCTSVCAGTDPWMVEWLSSSQSALWSAENMR